MMEYNIKLSIYFEIKDSPVFGGLETVGYSVFAVNINEIPYDQDNAFNKAELMEAYIAGQVKKMAELCEVSEECVRVISKKEYEENTEEDEAE